MKKNDTILLLMLICAPVWAQHMEPLGLEGMKITSLAITPAEQGIPAGIFLYAGTDGQGVFQRNLSSPDSSWTSIGLEGKQINALYVYHWGVGPADFNTLFAAVAHDWSKGDSTRLYRYTSEEKWVPSDSGMDRTNLNHIQTIRGLFFLGHEPPRALFATAGYEMYRSFDAGRRWERISPGPGFAGALEVHQSSGLVWAGGIFGRDFPLFPWINRSPDQGMTWQSTGSISLENVAVLSLVAYPRDSSIVYAALYGNVLKSIDTGETWSATGLKDLGRLYLTLAIDPDDPSHLWAGGEDAGIGDWQMMESFDGGDTWASIPPPQCHSNCRGISDLATQPGKGHAVYVAKYGNGVWFYRSRLAPPKVIRVPEDFATIQTAIDSATAGDTILVSPGIYAENLNFRGKNVVLKSVQGPDKTFIDGKQNGSVVTFSSGEDSTARLEGFTLRNGSGTVSEAFGDAVYGGAIYCFSSSPTIRRNVMRENVVLSACGALGGGIAIIGNSAPVIEGNHLYDNMVISFCDALVNFGGGIFVAGSTSPRLRENTIIRNSADFGGGIAVMDTARPVIQRNIITQNIRGGILVTEFAQPVIGGSPGTGNDIAENDGHELERRLHDAGQIEKISARYNYFGICPPTENEVFPLNEFDTSNCQRFAVRTYFPLEKGNAWTFAGPETMTETIIDTFTLGKCYFFYRFDQFRQFKDIALRLTEENKLTYRFDPMSMIEHIWVDFGAEIGEQWTLTLGEERWTVELQSKTDTVTVPAGTFTDCHRFHFRFSGDDNDWVEWYAPGVGPVKRVLLGFAVIEYPLLRAFIHGLPLSVNDRSGDERPAQFKLHQNYPNPLPQGRLRTGTGTVIRYDLPQTAFVLLEIYNLMGQKVRTLVATSQPLGRYEVSWNGRDDAGKVLPSGVYFYRLDAGNFTQVRKLTLVR